jgi:tetratricopeptide (TPR) repeat protein
LFELLTGEPPVSGSLEEVLERVQGGQLPRPREREPGVARPLDSICARALARQPLARYATPQELADDVQRWLDGDGVLAHDESLPETIERGLRKHSNWTLAVLVTLAVTACLSLTAWWVVQQAWWNESAARQAAEDHKADAILRYRESRQYLDRWVTGASEVLSGLPEAQTLRVQLLKDAARDLERLAQQRSEDPELAREAARAQLRLGDVQLALTETAAAEQAYRRAWEAFTELLRRDAANVEGRIDVADARAKLGSLLALTGRAPAAVAEYEQARSLLQSVQQQHPEHVGGRERLAVLWLQLGELRLAAGQTGAAESDLRLAADAFVALTRNPRPPARSPLGAARTQILLGRLYAQTERPRQTLTALSDTVPFLEQWLATDQDDPAALDALGAAQAARADALAALGQPVDQLAALRAALTSYGLLQDALPHVRQHLENVATMRTNAGLALQEAGRSREAEVELRLALPLLQQLVEANPEVPAFREKLATCEQSLAAALADLGEDDQAAEYSATALQRFRELARGAAQPLFTERLAIAQGHHGRLLGRQGATPAALAALQAAAQLLDGLCAATPDRARYHAAQAQVYHHWAWVHQRTGQQEQAEPQFRQACTAWQRAVTLSAAPDYLHHGARTLLLWPQRTASDVRLATQWAQRAQQMCPTNVAYAATLASAYLRTTAPAECERLLGDVRHSPWGANAHTHFLLALAIEQRGAHAEAQAAYQEGVAWMRANQPAGEELERLRQEAATALGE